MEVLPGGQPKATGGKLSLDTLESPPPSRRKSKEAEDGFQDKALCEESVTRSLPDTAGVSLCKVWVKGDMVQVHATHQKKKR
jgi:hypothetical protein